MSLSDDLADALRDLSDAELAEQAAVHMGVRDALDAMGLRRPGRLQDVLAAMCAAERRRRRAELKSLEAAFRHGEEVTSWWS